MRSTVRLVNGEDALRILSEEAPIGACIMQDGRFRYVNSFFSSTTGYTADDLVGKDSLELVIREDRDMTRENTIKMLKGETVSPYQFRVICKDNGIIWVMATVKSIQYHGRQAVLGNYMEITGRKQMEDAVRESEKRYKELADSITDVFFGMNEHLRYTYWNKAAEILTGIRAEDAIGKSLREVFPDTPGRRRAEKVYCDVLKAQQPRTLVNDFDIDGRHYSFEISAYPSRGGISVFSKDITQRNQAQEALKYSEERYRTLSEQSLMGLVVVHDFHIIFANNAFAEISGYSIDELLSLPPEKVQAMIHAEDQVLVWGRLRDRLAGKAVPPRYEYRGIRKDGSVRWLEMHATRIEYNGKPAIQGVVIDVTERKQMEEALRYREGHFKTLIESSSDAITVVDSLGAVRYQSPNCEAVLGHDPATEVGKSIFNHVDDNDVALVADRFDYILKNPQHTVKIDVKAQHADGSWRTLEVLARNLLGDPAVCGIVVNFRDITERRKTEEALQKSQERYRLLAENAGEAILVVQDGVVKFINPKGAELSGYSLEELGSGPFVRFIHPDDVNMVIDRYAKRLKGEPVPQIYDFRITKKDGDIRWGELNAVSISWEDRPAVLCFMSDITDHKQAEEALRRSEERYRTVLEEMEDSYFEVDLGGLLTYVNRSTCRNLGYSREELIGMSYKSFTVEDDLESVLRIFGEVYQTGMSNRGFSWKVMRKDGTPGFAESSVSLLKNHNGEIIGFRGVGRDVTERRQTEEALRRSEERYRTMLEEMEEGYYETDLAGNFALVNDAMSRILGYSRDELIGMNYRIYTPEEDVKPVFQAYNHVYRTGEPLKRFPMPEIRKDGTRILAEDSVFPLRNEKGHITGFRGITRDITERKRMEESLRQSEENYRALFDNSVIGTIVLDAETMRILVANQAAARLFEFDSVEEGIGLNPLYLIVPEDKERVINAITKELFEQDLRMTHEFRAITKRGTRIWISATGARIMHERRLAGLISFTDISEQRSHRDRLVMTDRLASLGEMASGAAHELNNPLTTIIGFSQLLLRREVPDDIREDLKLINSEAERAADVTRNLLTFAGRHAPMQKPNQMNNIIEDVLRLRVYDHKARGIEVGRQFAPDLPEVKVDYFQMQQVVMNIIINAEYFMINAHNGGTLTITTKEENDTVVILFTDDGPGIPPENLGRIFDPFFTTKEAGKGTGLGLSICHGIVAEHGGQIYARSQLGRGATIVVELPVEGERRS